MSNTIYLNTYINHDKVTFCNIVKSIKATYTFFFVPFLPPLVSRLFLPTAMITVYRRKEGGSSLHPWNYGKRRSKSLIKINDTKYYNQTISKMSSLYQRSVVLSESPTTSLLRLPCGLIFYPFSSPSRDVRPHVTLSASCTVPLHLSRL